MAPPTQPAPTNDGIDLSAGLQPAATPPPQPSDGIDLSAGLQPATTPPQQDPSLLSQFWAARPHPIEEVKGLIKGMGDTAAGLLDMYGNAPGTVIGAPPTPQVAAGAHHVADMIRQHTTANNYSQEQGKIAETVAELLALPEAEGETIAAKIPTLSEHLGEAGKLAKFLEGNPKVAGMLRIGLDAAKGATRAGAEQAGQTLVKTGGDVPAAAEAGATGAIVGGTFGAGAGALRETGRAVANKVGQVLASRAAAEAAPSNFAASATDALQRAFDRLGGNEAAPTVSNFGQAAQALTDRASSIYDEADRATEGRWRPANAAVQAAKASGDPAAITAAQSKLDALSTGFDDANYGQSVKEATDRARGAFHDTHALQDIHDGLNKAFDFGTPETAAARGSANTFDGAQLSRQLKNLETDSDVGRERMVDLLGEDGLNSLYDLADTAKNPTQNKRLRDVMMEIATRAHSTGSKTAWASGMLGTFLPSGWAKTAGLGYAAGSAVGATAATAENLMNYVATKPRLVKLANYAAKHDVSPRYAATLLSAAINHEWERDQANAPAQPTTPPGGQP